MATPQMMLMLELIGQIQAMDQASISEDNIKGVVYKKFNSELRVLINTIRQKYPEKRQVLFDAIHKQMDEMTNKDDTSPVLFLEWKAVMDSMPGIRTKFQKYTPKAADRIFSKSFNIPVLK